MSAGTLADAAIAARRAERRIVIGSRKSDLAMWQARRVQALLSTAFPDYTFEIRTEATTGDHELDAHLAVLAAASPGLFTKELEVGLLGGSYDIAVHSLKDMPTSLPEGLALAAISEREDPRDALILSARHGGGTAAAPVIRGLSDLPDGALVGTSSVRREALLRRTCPGLRVASVRGNLATRFRKLDGEAAGVESVGATLAAPGAEVPPYDALLLAYAGVKRLGWGARVTARLHPSEWPYGVGQGALGLEVRSSDALAAGLARAVVHPASALACVAERAFMNKLQGGCSVPIGAFARFDSSPACTGSSAAAAAGTPAAGASGAAGEEEVFGAAAYPAAGAVATLTVAGTVCAIDGSQLYEAEASAAVQLPPAVGAGAAPEARVAGACSGAAAAGASVGSLPHAAAADAGKGGSGAAGSGSGSVADSESVTLDGLGVTAEGWAQLLEAGAALGRTLARRIIDAGALDVLGSLAQPRAATYGSAEAAGLQASAPTAAVGGAGSDGVTVAEGNATA